MSLQENIKAGIAMQAKIKVALIITGIVVVPPTKRKVQCSGVA